MPEALLRFAGVPLDHLIPRVLFIGCPNHRLGVYAEKRGYMNIIRPDPSTGTFHAGFKPSQFMRGAPLLPFYAETPARPYPYPRYFVGPYQAGEPLQVFSYSETVILLDGLLQDKASQVVGVHSRVTYSDGGAEVFLREYVAAGLAKDVVRTLQPLGLNELSRGWAFPWAYDRSFLWRFWLWISQPLNTVKDYFGHERALYFAFLQTYTRSLIIPAGKTTRQPHALRGPRLCHPTKEVWYQRYPRSESDSPF